MLTAFKVAAGRTGAALAPVRMSFQTDRPFYPYREPVAGPRPAAEPPHPRLLRVYFVAPTGRSAGALGSDPAGWPGRTAWADKLAAGQLAGVVDTAKLPAGELWLTEFEDLSSPRPGTDEVYFAPAADPTPIHRPPHVIDVYGPAEAEEWPVAGPVGALGGRWLLTAVGVGGGVLFLLAAGYAVRVLRRG